MQATRLYTILASFRTRFLEKPSPEHLQDDVKPKAPEQVIVRGWLSATPDLKAGCLQLYPWVSEAECCLAQVYCLALMYWWAATVCRLAAAVCWLAAPVCRWAAEYLLAAVCPWAHPSACESVEALQFWSAAV